MNMYRFLNKFKYILRNFRGAAIVGILHAGVTIQSNF